MIAYRGCEVALLRLLCTHPTLSFLKCQMVDAGSVMILATRFARPSSYPSSVERFDFLAVGGKAATLEMQGRKTRVGSQRIGGNDQAICLAHGLAVYMPSRLAVAVEAKVKVKVGGTADADVKMLEKRY